MNESDKSLLEALRRPVDEGGYDGFHPDPLHIQAANRIEALLKEIEQLDREPNRCPEMIPNRYGRERCGRERGHEGKHCYQRGD